MPHLATDVVTAACHMVTAFQTVVSRLDERVLTILGMRFSGLAGLCSGRLRWGKLENSPGPHRALP